MIGQILVDVGTLGHLGVVDLDYGVLGLLGRGELQVVAEEEAFLQLQLNVLVLVLLGLVQRLRVD